MQKNSLLFGETYQSEGLIALRCDSDLGRYLRSLFRSTFGIKLQAPSRKSHILITFPGEKSDYKQAQLSFSLEWNVFTNGNAFWVNVQSTDFLSYRSTLGLGLPPRDFHYCIGYKHETK